MDALRATAQAVLAADVSSIAHTVNLVFDSTADAAELETRLEAAVRADFGFTTLVFVRSAAHMAALVAHNPFPDQARDDPAHLVAMVMRQAPTPEQLAHLRAAIVGPEEVAARGSDLYARYPVNIGQSKLTSSLIERRLASPGTARNWNTVLKVVDALS
jgi:uncharacterized protein (DUF1697 family)